MMLGTVAAPLAGRGQAPAWPPAGATAGLDFVNGRYFARGAVRNVGDLLGGGFVPAAITPGIGMDMREARNNLPDAKGPFLADLADGLAAGCTIVMRFSAPILGCPLVVFGNDANYIADDAWIYAGANVDPARLEIEDSESDVFLEGDADLTESGPQLVAMTFARAVDGGGFEFALSANGGAAATTTLAYAPDSFLALAAVNFFHEGETSSRWDWYDARVLSITLYPAVTPAELPSLTAL